MSEFRELNKLPVAVVFGEDMDTNRLTIDQAKWHKPCYLKYDLNYSDNLWKNQTLLVTIHVDFCLFFVIHVFTLGNFLKNKVTDEGLRTENFDFLPSVIVLHILLVKKLSTYTIFSKLS